MIKEHPKGSFVGVDVKRRTKKKVFFDQVNKIINWEPLEKELYKIVKRSHLNAAGNPAYPPLLLFKMMLLQTWYGLSDEGVEDMVNDTFSANAFCDLRVEDQVPDHSTLSRFRKELTEKKAMDRLLKKINQQLMQKKVIIEGGRAIVDATLTESPWEDRFPTYEVVEDRQETPTAGDAQEAHLYKIQRVPRPGSDEEAAWVKKSKKYYYGYKHHIATDANGLILGVHTVAANKYEGHSLQPLLAKIRPYYNPSSLLTDKGYRSSANSALLNSYGILDGTQRKAARHRPLTSYERFVNKSISRHRYVVERTFGSCKRWFLGGIARYKGVLQTHTQHLMQAIAYNIKRSPGLIMSKLVI